MSWRGLRSVGPARPEAAPEAGRREATRPARHGLAPCLAYLFIEFGRPMAWITPLAFIRPGMLVGIWGLIATLARGLKRPIPKPLKYMFGFIALMVFHVPFATNNAWALWGLQDFAILIFGGVLPLVMLPSTFEDVRHLATGYVLFHIPSAIHGLLFGGFGLDGWMGDENDLALALNVAIGVGVYLLTDAGSFKRRVILMATIGTLVAGVVASKSRGGFIGLASLGLYMLFAGPRRGRIVLSMIVAIACLWAFAPAEYWTEIQSIRTANEEGDTGEGRVYLWKIGWKMFLDHPIVGVGTKNYAIRSQEYEDLSRAVFEGQHVWGRVSHSLYFTLLPEQGLVGTALFTAMILWCFGALRRLRRRAKECPDDASSSSAALVGSGLMAGIVALLVTGAFISVLYYPVIWVLCGLLAALDAVRSRETMNEADAAPAPTTRLRPVAPRLPSPPRG